VVGEEAEVRVEEVTERPPPPVKCVSVDRAAGKPCRPPVVVGEEEEEEEEKGGSEVSSKTRESASRQPEVERERGVVKAVGGAAAGTLTVRDPP